MLGTDNIGIPFDEWHTQQKHIVKLEESTWCINAYGDVQTLHNQRHEGVSLGQLGQQLLR